MIDPHDPPKDKSLKPTDYVLITMPDGTVLRTHDDVHTYLRQRYVDQPDTQRPPGPPPTLVLKS